MFKSYMNVNTTLLFLTAMFLCTYFLILRSSEPQLGDPGHGDGHQRSVLGAWAAQRRLLASWTRHGTAGQGMTGQGMTGQGVAGQGIILDIKYHERRTPNMK